MVIGYARVSTATQSDDLQRDALMKAGCERIFSDELSGGRTDRPGLEAALATLRSGDTLIVWRLDRLGRSLRHLVQLAEELKLRDIELRSLTEGIDTSTSAGQLTFHIFSALAEFERALIRERVQAGLEAAASRGRRGGRPSVVSPATMRAIKSMSAAGLTAKEICSQLKISRATLYRHRPQEEA